MSWWSRSEGSLKPKTRVICKITNCNHLTKGTIKYCSDCDKYPCKNLNHLDKRYRAKYGMSLIAVRPPIILAEERESGRTAPIARMIHWPVRGKKVKVPFRA